MQSRAAIRCTRTTVAFCVACALMTITGRASAQSPSREQFDRAVAYATRTDGQAVLVMHDGKIVYESYMSGGGTTQRQLLASGSKSFVGVATLAAVRDKLLTLDQRVADVLTEWRADTLKSRVTVRQLLSLESGIYPGNPGSGCGGPSATWNDAIAASALTTTGVHFAYGPFPFIATGAMLERLLTSESFEAYLKRAILAPLHIGVEWRAKCADGKPQLAGGAAMTARDWGTFGEFVRRGGVIPAAVGDARLLSDSLIQQLFVPSHSNPSYGMSWWLRGATIEAQPALGPNAEVANTTVRPLRRLLQQRSRGPSVVPEWIPKDLVMAAGAGKQRLYIMRSRGLVVVRLGRLLGGQAFQDTEFLQALLSDTAPKSP